MRDPRRRAALALLAAASLLAACAGGDDDDGSAADAPSAGAPTSASVTTEPGTTAPGTTEPATTEPATTEPDPTSPPETKPDGTEPSSEGPAPAPSSDSTIGGPGAGDDELFPELGTATLDVQHYDLRIAYSPEVGTIDGRVVITTAVTSSIDELVLDAFEVKVREVLVDGEPAAFRLEAQDLVVELGAPVGPLPADEPIEVEVDFTDSATSIDSDVGLPVGWFSTDEGSFVLNEPDGASTWFPSNDHPADKATWHFEITVPAGVTAVANGELTDERTADGATTWVWDEREPMSTYLMLLLTGDYEILDGGTYEGAGGTVPLTNVALRDDVERMQPYFDLTDEQLAFFEPYFGPYPLDRYGLAFSDSFAGLAMETQGRSLFSREDFSGELGYIEHLLLAHELAHQWFGNAVSPADWGDLWLNEAFASYGEWMWLDEAGFESIEQAAETNLAQRQSPTEPTGVPTVGNLFGYERYAGGAVVVHALRLELGDETFFTLLQRWVADNDGASRTTADFIALTEELAGRDMTAFFDEWLFAAAVPAEYPA